MYYIRNPGDPKAKAKFQQITQAYEILSDEKKRALYDSGSYNESTYQQSASAEDIFSSVQRDVEVIQEAFVSYLSDLSAEIQLGYTASTQGDWETVWDVVKYNRGIILGIVVPSIVILRFPFLFGLVARFAFAGSNIILAGLLRSGQLHDFGYTLWKLMVDMSQRQKLRATERQIARSRRQKK